LQFYDTSATGYRHGGTTRPLTRDEGMEELNEDPTVN